MLDDQVAALVGMLNCHASSCFWNHRAPTASEWNLELNRARISLVLFDTEVDNPHLDPIRDPHRQGGSKVDTKAGCPRLLFRRGAISLAFQLGQRLERLLLDQAAELAAKQGVPEGPVVVSAEDVHASLARLGLEALLLQSQAGVQPDGPIVHRPPLSA